MRNLSRDEIDEINNIYGPKGVWYINKVIEYTKKYGKPTNSLYTDLSIVEIIIEEKSFEKETEETEEDF